MPNAALDELLAAFGPRVRRLSPVSSGSSSGFSSGESDEVKKTGDSFASTGVPTGVTDLDALLPEGGFPRGVVELAAMEGLAGATALALSAVRQAQRRDRRAWCAWVEPEGTLYAPGVAAAGVDLERLFVVRPPRQLLGQVAVKVMAARAFEMVVVELDAVAMGTGTPRVTGVKSGKKGWAPEVLVRKLALLAEEAGSTVLLMTAGKAAGRGAPLPVALRLELERPKPEALALRIAKDRRGRGGLAKTVPFPAWTGTGGGGLSEVG